MSKNRGTTLSLCWIEETGLLRHYPPGLPLSSVEKKKWDYPPGQVLTIRISPRERVRDNGVKVIPMDNKRKRRIDKDKRGSQMHVDDNILDNFSNSRLKLEIIKTFEPFIYNIMKRSL